MDPPLRKIKNEKIHKSENETELTLKAFEYQKKLSRKDKDNPQNRKKYFQRKRPTRNSSPNHTNSSRSSVSKIHTNQGEKKGPRIKMVISLKKAYR